MTYIHLSRINQRSAKTTTLLLYQSYIE